MFSNASNFILNQPTLIDNSLRDASDNPALQILSQHVAQGATHNSREQYSNPKCHPDTRKQLLSDIKEWMLKPNKEIGMLYLHGPAGAGKSSIARSSCAAHGCSPGFLIASFFFGRDSEYRNNTMRLVTTVAYQLAKLNSDLSEHILAAIQQDPQIVDDAPLENQFRKLILEPCRYVAHRSGGQLNGVIIIDGLDECIDKNEQVSVLNLLASMANQERFALGFFITSRPELHLKVLWDTEDMAPVTQFISLSNNRLNTSDDIRTVLESGFSRILNDGWFRPALQSVPRPWPSEDIIETLVERSSEQFIYAATVLKFVSNRSRNPDAQLHIVLALPACSSDASPLAELDSLYHGILSRADDPARSLIVLSFLLVIMDITAGDGISDKLIHAINEDMNKQLLIVEQLIPLPRGEAFLALNDLHSLIDLDASTSDGPHPISFYHKSFRDFLLTSGRSKEFHIDIQATHVKIAKACAKFLCLPRYDTVEQHVAWIYSFFLWPIHINKSGKMEEIHNFEQPVQRFIGPQLHISHLHLKDAFKTLGLKEKQAEVVEVLTGFRRLSASILNVLGLGEWYSRSLVLGDEFSMFKRSSIRNPLLVAHLKSYKMDLLVVKRLLAIQAIISFRTLSTSDLYSTGIIHDFASLPEIQEDMISHSGLFDMNGYSDVALPDFLSSPRSSGIFACTSEDFADAYCDIINITPPASSEMQKVQWYSWLFRIWTTKLHKIKPAATPAFLAALKSTARDAHDQPVLIRSLTHPGEVYLLEWLESLPTPPQDIIDAWRKAFDQDYPSINWV